MNDKPLNVLAVNVNAACTRFQAVLSDEPHAAATAQLSASQHPSVVALTQLLREHEELLSRLGSNEQTGGRGDKLGEVANVAARRERVLTQGLKALGSIAVSMRAVLDDVQELVPTDNGYLPNAQEILSYGHRLRYTTFATMGLYSGEPAPQQLHFDHATLWERALAERHQHMAAAAVPVDPRAEAACRTLLANLVEAGWTPDAGFPEPVLAFLSDMPGALDVLRRLVEERFSGGRAREGEGGQAAPADGAVAAATEPPLSARTAVPPPPSQPVNPSSRTARDLMLDEDSDEGGSSSEYTTTEDESD